MNSYSTILAAAFWTNCRLLVLTSGMQEKKELQLSNLDDTKACTNISEYLNLKAENFRHPGFKAASLV